jgi:Holliday junction resolvase-like predicted endonuclease
MGQSKHQGAQAELVACNYFLEQGFEVFRNVSQHGPADLAIWDPKTEETVFVDVKNGFKYVKTDGTVSVHFPKKPRAKCSAKLFIVVDGEPYGFQEWR